MAKFAKLLSCFSLIVLSICCHSQARESNFFSKYLHLSTNSHFTIPSTSPKVVPLSSPSPSPSPTSQISGVPASAPSGPDSVSGPLGAGYGPAPAPTTLGAEYIPASAPAPTTLDVDYNPTPAPTENDIPYYGLYGKNNNNEEEEEEEEEFSSADSNRETYTYSNDEPNSSSNNNGFWNPNHESYYNTNNGYDGGYKSDQQPQGMSDTRLADNGKYYNNVEREKYNPSVYDDNEEGYYGNYESKYEFDSMEEYEKQERYADVQEEFIP